MVAVQSIYAPISWRCMCASMNWISIILAIGLFSGRQLYKEIGYIQHTEIFIHKLLKHNSRPGLRSDGLIKCTHIKCGCYHSGRYSRSFIIPLFAGLREISEQITQPNIRPSLWLHSCGKKFIHTVVIVFIMNAMPLSLNESLDIYAGIICRQYKARTHKLTYCYGTLYGVIYIRNQQERR